MILACAYIALLFFIFARLSFPFFQFSSRKRRAGQMDISLSALQSISVALLLCQAGPRLPRGFPSNAKSENSLQVIFQFPCTARLLDPANRLCLNLADSFTRHMEHFSHFL